MFLEAIYFNNLSLLIINGLQALKNNIVFIVLIVFTFYLCLMHMTKFLNLISNVLNNDKIHSQNSIFHHKFRIFLLAFVWKVRFLLLDHVLRFIFWNCLDLLNFDKYCFWVNLTSTASFLTTFMFSPSLILVNFINYTHSWSSNKRTSSVKKALQTLGYVDLYSELILIPF